jgi:uncharacterized lipoprotein YddW (UPF0748 family)
VRGRGDAFYRSRWEPRAESIVKGTKFDPLALTIEEAHRRGMTVHAWLNTNFLANMDTPPSDPRHFYNLRPDLIAVPYKLARELYSINPRDSLFRAKILEYSKGARDRVEGVYMSPAAPETKEHVYSIWMDVLEHYDVDGMNFDYVRYPAPDYDYSRISLDRFRLWLLPQLKDDERARFAALESDPLVYVDSFPSRYNDFRRDQITELVERVRAFVDALRSSLDKGNAYTLVDQDSVRGVLGRTASRDEAVKILQPEVLVTPSFVGTGDTVKIYVSVRDLRNNGVRVLSADVMPAYPQYYLAPIVQAVLKRLEEVSHQSVRR